MSLNCGAIRNVNVGVRISAIDTRAAGHGGAFHIVAAYGAADIPGITVTRATAATGHGGGLFLQAATSCSVAGSVLTMDTISRAGSGGAAWVRCSGSTINFLSFVSVTRALAGGGSGGGLMITGGAIPFNLAFYGGITIALASAASGDGGGLAVAGSDQCSVFASVLSVNDANASLAGGGMNCNCAGGCVLTSATLTFDRTNAVTTGGALNVVSGVALAAVTSNAATAGQHGGAIAILGTGSAPACTFAGNIAIAQAVAGGRGGAVYAACSTITTSGPFVTITVQPGGLASATEGGVLFASASSAEVVNSLPSITATGGTVAATAGRGGVLVLTAPLSNCTVGNIALSASSATANGGAINVDCAGDTTVGSITAAGTVASAGDGGLLYSSAPAGVCSIGTISVTGNSSAQMRGGIVYARCAAVWLLSSVSAATVSAPAGGGGLHLTALAGDCRVGGPVTLTGAADTSGSGAGIYADCGRGITMQGFSAPSATVGVSGGGLFLRSTSGPCTVSGPIAVSTAVAATGSGAIADVDCGGNVILSTVTSASASALLDGGGVRLRSGSGSCNTGAIDVARAISQTGSGGAIHATCAAGVFTGALASATSAVAQGGSGGLASLSASGGGCSTGGVTAGYAFAAAAGGALQMVCAGSCLVSGSFNVDTATAGADGGLARIVCGASVSVSGVVSASSAQARTGNGGALYLNSTSGSCLLNGGIATSTSNASVSGGVVWATCLTGITLWGVSTSGTAAALGGLGGSAYLVSAQGTCQVNIALGAGQAYANGDGGLAFVSCANGVTMAAVNVATASSATGSGGIINLASRAGTCNVGAITNTMASASENGGAVAAACAAGVTIASVATSRSQAHGGHGGVLLLASSAGACTVSGSVTATVANASQSGGVVAASCAGGVSLASVSSTAVAALNGTGGMLSLLSLAGDCRVYGAASAGTATATDAGGLIFMNCGGNIAIGSVSVVFSNTTASSGGVAYLQSGGSIVVSGGTVTSARAALSGGCIWASGANVNVSALAVGTATASGGEGGALFIQASGSCNILSSTFTAVTARDSGGAGLLYCGTAGIRSVTVVNAAAATGDGGAFALLVRALDVADLSTNFTTAAGRGGALALINTVAASVKLRLMHARAGAAGGAVSLRCGLVPAEFSIRPPLQIGCKFEASDVQIRNATSPVDGGAIAAESSSTLGSSGNVPYLDVKLDNALIQDTHAGGEGGAISLRADYAQQVLAQVSLTGTQGSRIDSCTAQTRGGAIAISYGTRVATTIVTNPEMLLTNATISNCVARTAEGGALALQRTASTLVNSILFNNTAGTVGGAISARDFSSVLLADSQVVNNRALGGNGGGIAASQCTSGIQATSRVSSFGLSQASLPALASPLDDTAFALAAADWIAAWSAAGTLGTIIADNTALTDGGGLSAQGCTIRLAFASFLRNYAGGIGGAIAATSSRDTPFSAGPAVFASNVAIGTEGVGGGAIALVAEKAATFAADISSMTLNSSLVGGRLIRTWTTRLAALAASRAAVYPLDKAAVATGLRNSTLLNSLVRPLAGPVSTPIFQLPAAAVPAGKQGPPALDNRTAHILMLGNTAVSAAGGDLHLAAATASSPSLIVRGYLTIGSSAVDAGGSMFLKSIPDVQIASGTWLQGSASYGPAVAAGAIIGGGCVGVETGEKLNMTDVVFRNCSGSFGGAVFYSSIALQQSAAQCIVVDTSAGSGTTNASSTPAAATTGIIASSIYFSGNAAARAGGNVYLHRTLPPTCTGGCSSWTDPASVTELSTVGGSGYGPNIATGPRNARALPTQYNGTWVDVSETSNLTASGFRQRPGYLVVTADTPLPDPLISIEITDAYGQQVRGDSRSICAINIVREGSGFLIPLRFPSTYTATSGVVNIWPFAAVVGPGVAGTLQVRCRGFDGSDMPELMFPFATASALVEWAPETLNRTIVALPSSLTRRYPLSMPVTVRLVDALGNLLPLNLSCSLVIAADAMLALNAGDATRALSAGIVSGSSSVIVNGYGGFTPAFSADGGSIVALGARAVWSTGDVLESRIPLLVQISRITSVWVAPGIPVCRASISGSAFTSARGCVPLPALSLLFASSTLAALGLPALAAGTAPAAASASVLSAVVPLPNAAAASTLGLVGRGAGSSSLPSTYSPSRMFAWPAPTHVLLRRLNGTARDASVSLTAAAGVQALPDIEVVPLHGSPVWGASLLMPLMQALPGSGDVVSAVVFDPPPRVAVLAEDSTGSVLTEIASIACQLSFSAGSAIAAAADAYTSLAADPTAVHSTVSASAEMAGDLRATTSRGIATFTRAALRAAAFESLSSCSATCAWSTSEQAATPPRIVRAGRASLISPASEWPTAVVPSGSGAGAVLAIEPPPVLSLNSLLLDAASWNVASASGAAAIGAGSGIGFLDGTPSLAATGADLTATTFRAAAAAANATLWSAGTALTLLPGFDLLCSARAVTLSLPADISRAAISRPQTVGESDAVLDKMTGKLTLKNLGIAGPLGSVVQLDVRCGFVNGEDVRFLSPPIRLVNIRAGFAVQPPALTLPSNPAAPTAWSPSPAVQLTWNPGTNASAYEPLAGDAARRFAIECSISVLDASSAWSFAPAVYTRFAPGTSSQLAVIASAAPVLPQLGGRTILPADANGYLSFSDLSASGSFGAQFRLLTSCRAPSAETFIAISSAVRFLLPTVAWGAPADGAAEATAPAESAASSVAATYPASQPAPYAYYDTEVAPYAATMAYVIPTAAYSAAADAAWMTWWIAASANASSATAAAAAAARLPAASMVSALVSRNWASVSRDGDLRCQVVAYLQGPLPGQAEAARFAAITGVTQKPALVAQREALTDARAFGSALFDGTTFRPTYPAPYQLHTSRPNLMPPLRLSLELTCTAREIAATPRIIFNVTMQRLRIGFILAPPDRGLPSPQQSPSRFYPVVVGIYNETGGIAADAPGIASCQLICKNATYPDAIPPADRRVSFFGNEAGPVNGVADFSTFAFSSPLGMLMLVQAVCTRTQGDAIASMVSEMAVDVVAVAWTARVPSIILYNTPVPVTVTVLQYNAQGQPRPAPSLDCTLSITSKWADVVGLNVTSALQVNPPVYASNTDGVFRSMTNTEGVASFSLALMGLYNISAFAQVTCRVGEVDARSLEAYTRLEQIEAFFVRPPPTVWLPTSGLAKTPIDPAPTILFRTTLTRMPADAVGTRCSVAFRNAAGSVFTVEAKTGYRITLPSEVLDNKTSPAGLAQYMYYATTTPIELAEILLGAPFGETFEMVVLCTRAQLDSVRELVWPMRSPRAAIRWAILPPTLSAPQRVFRAAAVIVDRDALPADRARLEAVGALRHWQQDHSLLLTDGGNSSEAVVARPLLMGGSLTPLLVGIDNASATAEQLEAILPLDPDAPAVRNAIVHLDNVSLCTLGLDADMPSNFQVLSARSTSERGLLEWPAAAIFAPTGTPIRGSVTCALGSQRLTSSVRWALDMIPCEVGFVPTADGFQCQSCPAGTYSDGGAIHKACVKCPLGGVDCSAGKLQFLTGFYRFDDGLDTLTSKSELYPCWNPVACIVNTSTPSRAARDTHRCAEGYKPDSPLCGICDAANDYARTGRKCTKCWPRIVNMLIVSMIPVGISGAVVYISLTKTADSAGSRVTIYFKLLLTLGQTLGTLGSMYVARGTALFREIFGITEAVGSSILEVNPVQCSLRLTYSNRFYLTLLLPLLMAFAAIFVNIVRIIGLHMAACCRAWERPSLATACRCKRAGTVNGRMLLVSSNFSSLVEVQESEAAIIESLEALSLLDDLDDRTCWQRRIDRRPRVKKVLTVCASPFVAVARVFTHYLPKGVCWLVKRRCGFKRHSPLQAARWSMAAGSPAPGPGHSRRMHRLSSQVLHSMVARMASQALQGGAESLTRREVYEATLSRAPTTLLTRAPKLAKQWATATVSNELLTARRHMQTTANESLSFMRVWPALRIIFRRMGADFSLYFKLSSFLGPVVFILSISFSSLVATAFNHFNCLDYTINKIVYLQQDLNVRCDGFSYRLGAAFAVATITAGAVGIPLLFAWVLWRNRFRLHTSLIVSTKHAICVVCRLSSDCSSCFNRTGSACCCACRRRDFPRLTLTRFLCFGAPNPTCRPVATAFSSTAIGAKAQRRACSATRVQFSLAKLWLSRSAA